MMPDRQPQECGRRFGYVGGPQRVNALRTREGQMLQLTRRNLLTGAAATVALGTAPQLARAAAPIIGKQGPSFYRYKVGDFEVTALSEGVVRNTNVPGMAVNQ